MDNPKSSDKWRQFFAAMADGLLPYLQLYVKRNQRGSGVGNFVSSRYRYQVPFIINNSTQIGRGTPTSAHVQMIAPTQQTVAQAKSIIKQEDEDLKDMIGSKAIKRKYKSNLNQTKAKRQSKSKQIKPKSKVKKGRSTKKKASKKINSKYKELTYQDIFS